MEEKKLLHMKFGSFLKFYAFVSFSLGALVGVLGFLISLIGGDVTVNLGATELTGVLAGVVGIVFFPALFYVMGIIGGLIAFLPFKLFIKLFKGLNLKMEIK